MRVRFKISEESFFNNGKIILNAIPEVRDNIRKALSQEETVADYKKKTKGQTRIRGD